jgi:hypothetical protein
MYEGMTADYINKGIENDIGAPARRKLQIREILDELLARYYDLETETETWPDNARDEAIRKWVKDLDSITGSLRQVAVEKLKRSCRWTFSKQQALRKHTQQKDLTTRSLRVRFCIASKLPNYVLLRTI